MTKPLNYIDNSELLNLVVSFNTARKEAALRGDPAPRIPDALGIAFWKLSQNIAERYNFRKYPFIEDMIVDGLEDCLKRVHNFDPTISTRAFSYFTITIFRAFVRRIKSEKRYLKAKIELTEYLNVSGMTADSQAGDHSDYGIEMSQTDESLEYLR